MIIPKIKVDFYWTRSFMYFFYETKFQKTRSRETGKARFEPTYQNPPDFEEIIEKSSFFCSIFLFRPWGRRWIRKMKPNNNTIVFSPARSKCRPRRTRKFLVFLWHLLSITSTAEVRCGWWAGGRPCSSVYTCLYITITWTSCMIIWRSNIFTGCMQHIQWDFEALEVYTYYYALGGLFFCKNWSVKLNM